MVHLCQSSVSHCKHRPGCRLRGILNNQEKDTATVYALKKADFHFNIPFGSTLGCLGHLKWSKRCRSFTFVWTKRGTRFSPELQLMRQLSAGATLCDCLIDPGHGSTRNHQTSTHTSRHQPTDTEPRLCLCAHTGGLHSAAHRPFGLLAPLLHHIAAV